MCFIILKIYLAINAIINKKLKVRKKMEIKKLDTIMIKDTIERCETLDDYKEMFEKNLHEQSSFYSNWGNHINNLRCEHSLMPTDIAKGLGVSKASASRFINNIPSKRRNVIMLAMMFHMNLDETNELLVRWAKYQKLYVKNPEDAIWIYMINTQKFDSPAKTFEAYYNGYLKLIPQTTSDSLARNINTLRLDKELLEIINDKAFMDWMVEQIPVHKKCCHKLIDHLDLLLSEESINQWFGNNETLKRDKYYRKIRDLKEKGRIPERDFLISLGLRLKLGTEAINELLNAAGMGPLLAKDQIEGLVMFFIEELYCTYPSMFVDDNNPYTPYLLDEEPDITNANEEPDEFPADSLADYVKIHIEESGIIFKEINRVKELLELI